MYVLQRRLDNYNWRSNDNRNVLADKVEVQMTAKGLAWLKWFLACKYKVVLLGVHGQTSGLKTMRGRDFAYAEEN